ncbi:MAG: Spy0128 family protein [Collinsella sp.]
MVASSRTASSPSSSSRATRSSPPAPTTADGKITMDAVKYDKAGKHTYTLREVNGGTTSKGITYSDAKFTIETTITDNGDGTLKAEHVLKGDATAATFKNTYSVTPLETEVDFDLSKAIDGRDWTDTDEFSFTITAAEGDVPLPDPATVTVSKHECEGQWHRRHQVRQDPLHGCRNLQVRDPRERGQRGRHDV